MLNNEILFTEVPGKNGDLGVMTLNRPQALNALNHAMFLSLHQQLKIWAEAKNIKAVIIQAQPGRAFCAGGDIRSAYERGLAKDATLHEFFRDEYLLDLCIYHFPKPYLAFLDGITMGGGVGISINASHKIATERFLFAMPETGIGFFPDIGGSYFLPRLPGKIGFYLGLTGARLSADESYEVGIVNHLIKPDMFSEITKILADTSLDKNADATISDIINQFAVPVKAANSLQHRQEIDACFAKNSVEEIILALENYPSEWCYQTAQELKKKSPTSLKITLRQLQLGAKLSFDECLQMEYRLTSRFIQGHDFFEGVRAAIIDKDQKPLWKPNQLNEVTEETVEKYFAFLSTELY